MRRFGWMLAATLLLGACSDSTGPDIPAEVCAEGTTLRAENGGNRYTWSPSCRAAGLSVSGYQNFWQMTLTSNSLVSPVEYGEEPDGSAVVGQADPLGTGEEYTAVLLIRTSSQALDTVGLVTFVP